MDDRALVQRILDGDREIFRVIVEREQASVYRACLRVLGQAHEAEDVAQESFVMAYRALGSYRGDGALRGWLMRIATRQAFRQLKQRRSHDPLEETMVVPGPAELEPMHSALSAERQEAVRRAVGALPDPFRECVALRFFGELSLEEISQATGRNLNTVKTHLRRGLERLRRDLLLEAVA